MTPPVRYNFHGLDGGQETNVPRSATEDRTDSSGGAGAGNGTEMASEGLPGPSSSSFQPMEAATQRINERQSPQSIEVMRHAIIDSTLPDIPLPYQTAVEAEQQTADVSGKEKEYVSPIAEEFLDSGDQPSSFQHQTDQVDAAVMEQTPNLFGSHMSFGKLGFIYSILYCVPRTLNIS